MSRLLLKWEMGMQKSNPLKGRSKLFCRNIKCKCQKEEQNNLHWKKGGNIFEVTTPALSHPAGGEQKHANKDVINSICHIGALNNKDNA